MSPYNHRRLPTFQSHAKRAILRGRQTNELAARVRLHQGLGRANRLLLGAQPASRIVWLSAARNATLHPTVMPFQKLKLLL